MISNITGQESGRLRFRHGILKNYPDVLTPDVIDALESLAGFNRMRLEVMNARIARRSARFKEGIK
ncbi:MAG: hypothetical protein EHM30_03595, partial [Desulfobacteraceae bacterium]